MSLARPIAWGAGDILMKYYQEPQDLEIRFKGGEEGNVTSADLAANDLYYTLTKSQKEADRQRPPASFCSEHQQNE